MSIRRLIVHPILFSIYPVLAIFSSNTDLTDIHNLTRPLLTAAFSGLIVFLISRILLKDWDKAGLLASLVIVLFFSYGHIYSLIEGNALSGHNIGRHRYLLFAWSIAFFTGGWWIWKKLDEPRKLTNLMNIIAITALILPMVNISNFLLSQTNYSPQAENANPANGNQNANHSSAERLPDVYYIILDAYGRQDILKSLYQYDNSNFLNHLSNHGFFIAEKSTSNYGQTILSLSSSMNLNYIEALIAPSDTKSTSRTLLISAIKDSLVRRVLESQGYTTITFDSGYYGTKIIDADYYLTPSTDDRSNQRNIITSLSMTGSLNPFEAMILQNSVFRVGTDMSVNCMTNSLTEKASTQSETETKRRSIISWKSDLCQIFSPLNSSLQYPFTDHRARILFTLDELQSLPETGTPRFIFAHIVAPHHPYVFGPNGEVVKNPGATELFQNYEGTRQSYIAGYIDQTTYINKRILDVVDKIISDSETPPIIILQADHGPDANAVGSHVSPVPYMVERFSILNAYYLPPSCSDDQLYDSISPVNSFRVIFNTCFGSEYELLEDRGYFSPYDRPFDFMDVSEQLWR